MRKKVYIFLILLLCICIFVPSLMAGICLTDEIELRLNNVKGFANASKIIISETQYQGRITNAIPFILFSNIAFAVKDSVFFRGISALILIFIFLSVSFLLYSITDNVRYSILLFIVLLVFMPFTFEHTIPNGFVAFLGMPFASLLWALIFYIKYLILEQKKWLASAGILLFIALLSYEAFITFTPMFLILAIWKKGLNIKELIRKLLIPFFVSLLYLAIYIGQSLFFPSHYAGNTIGIKSLRETFLVIINLFKTGIPGYFPYTEKYRAVYYSGADMINLATIGTKIKYFIEQGFTLRCLFIVVLLCVLIWLGRIGKAASPQMPGKFFILGTALAYMFIPSIPNSIASFYQGNVHQWAFMALPVSFYIYVAGCVAFTTAIWTIWEHFPRVCTVILMLSLAFVTVPVQAMNEKVLENQKENWEKYLFLESMLGTETVKNAIAGQTVLGVNIYPMVAERYTYVSLIADCLYGYETEFVADDADNVSGITIRYNDDGYFTLHTGDSIYMIAKEVRNYAVFFSANARYLIVPPEISFYDNGLIVSKLLLTDEVQNEQ